MVCVWRVVRKSLSEEKTLKLGVMVVGGSHGGIQGKCVLFHISQGQDGNALVVFEEIKDSSAVCATKKQEPNGQSGGEGDSGGDEPSDQGPWWEGREDFYAVKGQVAVENFEWGFL